ncbi:MAG TPA: zf-HC2 domain-containing protein [Caulobacteraceae bacterium]|jgi:anti-sigma factor RsiW|nr:zf-HC2 domain-containing protein [Caulobacteraceae bacterium]
MTGRIIPLPEDPHRQAELLLPWYVTGQLDEAERALIEAHMAGCMDCRAQMDAERRVRAEFADLPVEGEHAWLALRDRIAQRRKSSVVAALLAGAAGFGRDWRSGAPWLRWAVAGQLAALVLALGVLTLPHAPDARYHALGAAPRPKSGDIVVMFRPETSERAFRDTLKANNARLVDGPTSTDAYLLYVPLGQRPAALARLRGAQQVVFAEPVDAGGPP